MADAPDSGRTPHAGFSAAQTRAVSLGLARRISAAARPELRLSGHLGRDGCCPPPVPDSPEALAERIAPALLGDPATAASSCTARPDRPDRRCCPGSWARPP